MTARLFDTLETRTMNSASVPTVAGYLPDWNATPAMIAKLDYTTLNTINYFSVDPDSTGYIPGSNGEAATSAASGQSLSRLQDAVTAAHGHNLKINIVIGGAGHEQAFENFMGSATKRNTFAQSVKNFCNRFGLDGVDFDYEPPGNRGATVQQLADYGKLIHAVDSAAPNLHLSAAVIADKIALADPKLVPGTTQQQVVDGVPQWNEPNWSVHNWGLTDEGIQHLDQIGVMAYDFTPGAGNADMTHALETMNAWANHAAEVGGSREQILLGLPFYGRAGAPDWEHSTPAGAGNYGAILEQSGTLPASANSATVALEDAGLNHELDNVSATYYFDGPDRIQAKTQAAINANVGGVMIWDVTGDYWNSNGTVSESQSLIRAVKRGLGQSATTPSNPTTPTGPVDTNTARIVGHVFYDGDANGIEDGDDFGISQRTVFLDTNNNGVLDTDEKSTQTDNDGKYAFEELPSGTYNVRLVSQRWTFSTTPIGQQVHLDINEDVFDVNFGECATYRRR